MKTSENPRVRFAAVLLLAIALLGGCATPPPTSTRTTVVLMPDEDSTVGAVSVSTASGSQRLDKAFSYTSVNGSNAAPSKARTISRHTIDTAYGTLLKAQPTKPTTFILQFLLDKTELTEESKAMLPAIFGAVRERKPTRITVFGHTDAIGTKEGNLKLSADRAEAAAHLLRTNDPSLNNIEVQFFGDAQPLTPSGPGASDPRNRRVEILIL
ncbi:OmpA family protein [Hydrogenophaga sp.]|uniref:OmpA family protein n=1 Tax=Hydrogenophaga sp. TaxID=1904254 RepID=UPI002FCB9624